MTTILAYKSGDGVYIGCDGQRTLGHSHVSGKDEIKWTFCGRWAFGVAGSAFFHNVIRKHSHQIAAETCEFEATARLREGVQEENWPMNHETATCADNVVLILADHENVWELGSEIYPYRATIAAEGSGGEYALGAMHGLQSAFSLNNLGNDEVIEPVDAMVTALSVAARCDAFTGGTLRVWRVQADGEPVPEASIPE